jgi:hypothetical protein
MNAHALRSEAIFRMIVSAVAMLLVLMAGGRTQWQALTESEAGISEVSAATLPGTTTLISDALRMGEIGAETALLYRVYALYGDERLPDAYHSVVAEELDGNLLCEVVARWAELSPLTQDKLAPFFSLGASATPIVDGCAR